MQSYFQHPKTYRRTAFLQNGQALVEFLVIAGALVSLFLLMPYIAKYQDIAHATQMASRYAAFDITVNNNATGSFKPETQLADEVRRRFFSSPDAPIKTNDVAGDFKGHQNMFWQTPEGKPLIKNFADVVVTFGEAQKPAHADGFKSSHDGTLFSAPFANAGTIGLAAQGVYRANISVPLANLPAGLKLYEPFDKINLSISRHASIVPEPWMAASPTQTNARVAPLAPANALLAPVEGLMGAVIETFEVMGKVKAPEFGRLQKWEDVVPADRLRPQP